MLDNQRLDLEVVVPQVEGERGQEGEAEQASCSFSLTLFAILFGAATGIFSSTVGSGLISKHISSQQAVQAGAFGGLLATPCTIYDLRTMKSCFDNNVWPTGSFCKMVGRHVGIQTVFGSLAYLILAMFNKSFTEQADQVILSFVVGAGITLILVKPVQAVLTVCLVRLLSFNVTAALAVRSSDLPIAQVIMSRDEFPVERPSSAAVNISDSNNKLPVATVFSPVTIARRLEDGPNPGLVDAVYYV